MEVVFGSWFMVDSDCRIGCARRRNLPCSAIETILNDYLRMLWYNRYTTSELLSLRSNGWPCKISKTCLPKGL